MFKKIITTVFLMVALFAKAHQPSTSTTMLVEQNNTWVLQISASLTAFQYEIETHYGKDAYKTSEEFQAMVLEHVKKNLNITFNSDEKFILGKGIVKIGHETKVVFEVVNVPSDFKTIKLLNSSFKDIYNNQSALVILKEGVDKDHFVLNNKNNHTQHLMVEGSKYVLISKSEASFFTTTLLFIIIGLTAGVLGLKIFISKKIKS